eukprot:CAMPEP_0201588476 /NCGR_PEP_ID=MMETSP0190_2-20130828/155651_1 /ASSEMBLY_ACC=CAM_ASM_000263 /TAXON_ID=37353 /ORGANISM="Rosalina sp." /LENGTH=45 /DNA_ID= /DNA_START= /DNA_END= /DNA_ORIENTATION=
MVKVHSQSVKSSNLSFNPSSNAKSISTYPSQSEHAEPSEEPPYTG